MGRETEKPMPYSLNTQLFTVVGSGYVPDRVGEFGRETEWVRPEPRLDPAPKRWLLFYALAALVVLVANIINIGTLVHATTGPAKPAPTVQPSGGAPATPIFGGTETVRW